MAASASIIIRDPDILGGTPCFRGTRVPFKNLLDYIETGETLDEFLEDFPPSHVRWRLKLWNGPKSCCLPPISEDSYEGSGKDPGKNVILFLIFWLQSYRRPKIHLRSG